MKTMIFILLIFIFAFGICTEDGLNFFIEKILKTTKKISVCQLEPKVGDFLTSEKPSTQYYYASSTNECTVFQTFDLTSSPANRSALFYQFYIFTGMNWKKIKANR